MKKSVFFFAAVAALVTIASCNKSNAPADDQQMPAPKTEISLRTMSATKSAIDGTAFPVGYDMYVSAFRNLGSNPGEDAAADYFQDIRFTKDNTSGTWMSAQGAKYYPLDGTLDFLAVASAGYNTAENGIAPTRAWGASSNTAKQVVLTVPDNSVKFDDLMYAAANAQALSAAGTAMSFNHAMTSVVFTANCNVAYDAVRNAGITINSITVDQAKYSGTLTISNPAAGGGSGDLSALWSNLGDQKTHIAARVWNNANLGTNTSETALSGLNLTATSKSIASYPFGEAYVILPPQTAPRFTINYTIHNGFDADGTTPLNNTVQYQAEPTGNWEMGKKNIYDIQFTLTEIKIVPTVIDWVDTNKPNVTIPETNPEP